MKVSHLMPAFAFLALTACDRSRDSKSHVDGAETAAPQAEGFDRVWGTEKLSVLELEALIEQLDIAARHGTGLDPRLADMLLERLDGGIPESMPLVSWRHFFNSSLNALAATSGVGSDRMASVLMHVMEQDPDKIMRLYALQHIALHQPRTTEPLRGEIGRRVAALAYELDDEISGTAVIVMEQWQGVMDAAGEKVPDGQRAAALTGIMSDENRAADVRISAVHAAVDGSYRESLPAARAIATDPAQDAMLRKAAIHLIGQLGDADDAALLGQCAAENPRIAQAARPAMERLSDRLEGRPAPQLIPYR